MSKGIELQVGVPLEQILPVRHRNLRQGKPQDSARFPQDDATSTVHVAAFYGGELVGCATLLEEEHDGVPLRIRGMAVDESVRGHRIGAALCLALQQVARTRGQGVHCEARQLAVPLYARCGFRAQGEEYEVAGIGPHMRMVWP